MSSTTHSLVSAMPWDHKRLANSCFVTEVKGLAVLTHGQESLSMKLPFVLRSQSEATRDAPAGRKGVAVHVCHGHSEIPFAPKCKHWPQTLNWSGFNTYSSCDHS